MPKRVVVDSGPLIALFDKDDTYHKTALTFIKSYKCELITNHAVITEVTHLLDFSVQTQLDFLEWIYNGGISVYEIAEVDLAHIIKLVKKYSDLPVDYADATLVALCDRIGIRDIASVDKDFTIYRTKHKKHFRNLFFD